MTARVYIHVGEPKCATTYLQEIVWGNRTHLASQGLLLPGLAPQDHFWATQDLRGVERSDGDPAGSWQGEWDVLAHQARSAGTAALISHELLVGATTEQAARAVESLQPAQVHLVLTVRDIVSLLPAEWQETVKHRNRQTWETWLATVLDERSPRGRGRWFWTAHDTLEVLRRWSAGLPPEQVHVIPVPRSTASPDLLWRRFAGVLGIDANRADLATARPNVSLAAPEAEMLRRLNRVLPAEIPEWFYTRQVKELLAQELLAGRRAATRQRLRLPPEYLPWACDYADLLIGKLESSGYDIVGDLADLRPMPPDIEEPGTAPVSDAAVRDAAIAGLAGVLHAEYRYSQTGRWPIRGAGRLDFRGAYRLQRAVRELSAKHPAVARLRVVAWRVFEAGRARRAARR